MSICTMQNNEYKIEYEVIEGKAKITKTTNNGEIVELTNEDFNIINNIFKKVMISRNMKSHFYCGNIAYNNNMYNVFYDMETKQKYVSAINQQNRKTNLDEDYIAIDSIINPVMYFDENDNKNSIVKKIKRLVVVGGTLFIVTMSLNFYRNYYNGQVAELLEPTQKIVIKDNNYNQKKYQSHEFINIEENENFVNTLYEVLSNNSNLTEEDKELIKNILNIVTENLDFISTDVRNTMINRLSTFNIIYNDEIVKNEMEQTLNGTYEPEINAIMLNNYGEHNVNDYKYKTLVHELIHMLFSTDEIPSLGYSMAESITDIIAVEYTNADTLSINKSKSYTYWKSCTYQLIELLGIDTIKEYYFSGNNIDIILTALTDIGLNLEESIEMIGEMDNLYFSIPLAIKEAAEKNDGWYGIEDRKPAYQRFDELMRKAYTMKYNVDPEELIAMSACLYSEYEEPNCNFHSLIDDYNHKMKNEQNMEFGIFYNVNVSIIPPAFFSKKLLNSQEERHYTIEVDFGVIQDNDFENRTQMGYTIKLPTPEEELSMINSKGKSQ